jgi:hypothetical protein
MPFPCRNTNEDEWINVDLGVPVQIQPVEWRAWQQSKSSRPHQSSFFSAETSAARRRERWDRSQPNKRRANRPAEPDM